MANDSDGAMHLVWIRRFHLVLLPLGALSWSLNSVISSVIFLVGGIASLLLWYLHVWAVGRMFTPTRKQRWLYAIIWISKLALIVILLRVIVNYFHMEVIPFATGLLLFVVAIMLEAARLIISHCRPTSDNGNQLRG